MEIWIIIACAVFITWVACSRIWGANPIVVASFYTMAYWYRWRRHHMVSYLKHKSKSELIPVPLPPFEDFDDGKLTAAYCHAKGICTHCQSRPAIRKPDTLIVFGHLVSIDESSFCHPCTVRYMDLYATRCGTCNGPICVGEPVARNILQSQYRYTHLTNKCSPFAGLICGHWGEGKLEPLQTSFQEKNSRNESPYRH